MRDKKRIDWVLRVVRTYWKRNPDLRLGQIIVNANYGHDPFYIEDDQLMERLTQQINDELKWPGR